MNNKTKKVVGIIGLFLSIGVLSACNSFCSDQDTSAYRFGYDSMNISLFNTREDALAYANYLIPEGYEKVTLDTEILDKNGNKTTLISNEKFGDYNLYFIHTATLNLVNTSDATQSTNVVFGKNEFMQTVESSASTSLINLPYNQFYEEFDLKVLDGIYSKAGEMNDKNFSSKKKEELTFEDIYGYSFSDMLAYRNGNEDLLSELLNGNSKYIGRNNSLLAKYGYSKFYNSKDTTLPYANIEKWNDEIIKTNSLEFAMNSSFISLYESTLTTKIQQIKTCISIIDDGMFGHISNDPLNETVPITNKATESFWKSWGAAFKEHGFLEGLLVFPISYGVESLSHQFGMNGKGQILAILLVTLIIRIFFALISFPSTMQQQKMNFIQPEITKLQQKFPNANTNQYEKQRMAQAQMALYKKYKIHPFLSILILIVQFPLFIAVWNAMTGSASLSSDSFLGLYLSDTIWNTLKTLTGWPKIPGWWTALVLIILMSGSQILSMMLPQWIAKKRAKNVKKVGVSNTQNTQESQTKMMSWVMTIMVIFMGFTLPSAMGVYWFAGAIFSILQTLITQLVLKKKGF